MKFLAKYGDLLPAFFLPFAIYGLTLSPSVAGGDSAELINVAAALGVAHPPGYPLHTLLGHLFSLLPFSQVAQSVNLLSAFCSALASLFLYLAVKNSIKEAWRGLWAGYLAVVFFALSPWVWTYSTVAEVFPLNNLLLALTLYLFSLFQNTEDPAKQQRLMWLMAFVFGLAASNHHSAAFLVLPVAGYLIWRAWQLKPQPIFWSKVFGAFAFGMLPYLHLHLAASYTSNSLFLWGETTSWSGFWSHFLRSDYGTFQLGHGDLAGDTGFFNHLWVFAKNLSLQFLMVVATT